MTGPIKPCECELDCGRSGGFKPRYAAFLSATCVTRMEHRETRIAVEALKRRWRMRPGAPT